MMKVIKIGRSQSNDYVLQHPSVSSSHAEIRIGDNGYLEFIDHSTNGTLVNRSFVHNASCRLTGNETLEFPGHISVRVAELIPSGATVVDRFAASSHSPASSYSPAPAYKPAYSAPSYSGPQPPMGFGETLSYYFRHYADFSGRARRSEYWYIVLWDLIFSLVPGVNVAWALVTIIPGLAVSVRRLHDTGRSGWWLLLGLIPLVGFIVILIFTLEDSERRTNDYGESPKYGE
ncbi:MAG: DUF805 domain-containing protein [Bacteroidales bacterium]|nr:DUF805 domain-containing protein [Bacteroidales bacterium]